MSQTTSLQVCKSAIACLLIALLVACYTKYWITIDEDQQPELKIPQGKLRGTYMATRYNRKIFAFKGIPFAQPPVGDLRFKEPTPAGVWQGTLDATNDSISCPQMWDNVAIGDEDCLYLNVYTPQLPTGENPTLYPVMVYIFGGQFVFGNNNSTQWGPQYILDKDVVLVVPSYRLGILGFLSTGDAEAPGNFGLKDIVLALKWNRENIQYFGGDPDQVTLFGSSSGSNLVHFLTFSNLTNGLFHRYITQSGAATIPLIRTPNSVYANRATKLGQHLGCPTSDSKVLVDCLRSLNPSQLVDTVALFDEWQKYPYLRWGPTIEPDVDGALITDSITNLITSGKIRDLPWISSVSRDEGIVGSIHYYEKPEMFQEFLENIDLSLPHMLEYVHLVNNLTAYTAALRSYYLNDLTADRNVLLANLTLLFGDAMFIYPAYNTLQLQLAFAESPQYFCSFEYRGTSSYTSVYGGRPDVNYGVAHADELQYLFPGLLTFYNPTDSEIVESDWEMADIILQLWTSFATTGTPTLDTHGATIWTPFSSRSNYLQIGNEREVTLKVKYEYLKERMQFWDELTAATSWK